MQLPVHIKSMSMTISWQMSSRRVGPASNNIEFRCHTGVHIVHLRIQPFTSYTIQKITYVVAAAMTVATALTVAAALTAGAAWTVGAALYPVAAHHQLVTSTGNRHIHQLFALQGRPVEQKNILKDTT